MYSSLALGACVFLGLAIFADAAALLGALGRFSWVSAPAALVLALANYAVRYGRWCYYVRRLGIAVTVADNFAVFLSGLVMSVTPAKSGELLKAYLLQRRTGTPAVRSAPAVVAERLTDIVALILLCCLGIFTYRDHWAPVAAGAAGTAAVLSIVAAPGALPFILRNAGRVPLLRNLAGPLAEALTGTRLLIAPHAFASGVGLGVVAWFAECLGLSVVLHGFGADVGLIPVTFIYSFATIVGALTLLPGGIGTTEGSMSGLLALQGVPLADAVAATLVIRVCTLWFAVALGAATLAVAGRRWATLPGTVPRAAPETDSAPGRS